MCFLRLSAGVCNKNLKFHKLDCYNVADWIRPSAGHGSSLIQVSISSFSKGIFSSLLHMGPMYFNKCLFLSIMYFHDPSDMILFPSWFINGSAGTEFESY